MEKRYPKMLREDEDYADMMYITSSNAGRTKLPG